MNILPIFKSHYSIGKSILTLEDFEEKDMPIQENTPVSIIQIAKKHDLKQIFLADTSFSGFVAAYKLFKKHDIQLIFGIELCLTANIDDKSQESLATDSKVTVWLKNSNAYSQALKIYSKAACQGFYYAPRIDIKSLEELWTDDLALSINFYDGAIHNNLIQNGNCMLDFVKIKPNMFWTDTELPFDSLIKEAVFDYARNEGLETQEIHPVMYYKRDDFKAFQVYRCISNRSKMDKPELNHFASDNFCFEAFLEKTGKKLES